jgi:hypothetical protein
MSQPSPSSKSPTNGETTSHHNESMSTDAKATATGEVAPRVEPQLPHEIDESRHSQARASEQQKIIGEQAYRDVLSPSTDTDRGPVLDKIYNEQIAPDRGDAAPRP